MKKWRVPKIWHPAIRAKLIGGFAGISLIILIVGIVGFKAATDIGERADYLATVNVPELTSILTIREAQTAVLAGERSLTDRRKLNRMLREVQYENIDKALARAKAAWDALNAVAASSAQSESIAKLSKAWDFWLKNHSQVRELALERDEMVYNNVKETSSKVSRNERKSGSASQKALTSYYDTARIIEQMVSDIQNSIQKSTDATNKQKAIAGTLIKGASVAGCLTGLFIGISLAFSITRPLGISVQLLNAAAQGDVSIEVPQKLLKRHDEIKELGESIRNLVISQRNKAEVAEAIACGDLTKEIAEVSDRDVLGLAFKKMEQEIRHMVSAIDVLVHAAAEGRLDVRADTARHEGDFRTIVEGVNAMFESVVQPLSCAAECIDRISKGDIPPRITEEYNGDFNTLNINLNVLIDTINGLVDSSQQLAVAAIHGRLRTRGDLSQLNGAYRNLLEGVNATLDSIVVCLDNIPMPLQFMDPEFQVQFLNRAAQDMLHVKSADVDGAACGTLWNTALCNDRERCPCAIAMNTSEVQTTDLSCCSHGKQYSMHAVSAALHASNGDLTGCFEILIDQTSLKQSMEKSRRTAEYQNRAVQKLTECLTQLAEGDLTVFFDVPEGDEWVRETEQTFNQLADTLSLSLKHLSRNMTGIRNGVEKVEEGFTQISVASTAVSDAATHQASSLEEISSSVTEIATQTKGNARSASAARELAVHARDASDKGRSQMEQMMSAMTEINQSSQQIAHIMKTIDGIAFQTNLLALNAAVEAARAGIHGKGFAVVADEVRNLAGRSAKAAAETAVLIEESDRKIKNGVAVAVSTTESFDDIFSSIEKTAQLVGEIADASTEQAEGISQINIGLSQLDEVTQQNTAHAEETASSVLELGVQSGKVKTLISEFRLDERSEGEDTPQLALMNEEKDIGDLLLIDEQIF